MFQDVERNAIYRMSNRNSADQLVPMSLLFQHGPANLRTDLRQLVPTQLDFGCLKRSSGLPLIQSSFGMNAAFTLMKTEQGGRPSLSWYSSSNTDDRLYIERVCLRWITPNYRNAQIHYAMTTENDTERVWCQRGRNCGEYAENRSARLVVDPPR
jgi:hypothetical protein